MVGSATWTTVASSATPADPRTAAATIHWHDASDRRIAPEASSSAMRRRVPPAPLLCRGIVERCSGTPKGEPVSDWAASDHYVVISSDGHAGADLLDYRPFLERDWLDE